MILRTPLRPRASCSLPLSLFTQSHTQRAQYATVLATTPAPSQSQIQDAPIPIQRHPSSQPPSYRPPEIRKSQIHRQYTSLLRSTPLMLVIQHNNLKASEWAGIRRELALALKKAAPKPTEESLITPAPLDPSETIRIQIIQTGIFAAALRVTEFFRPQQSLSLDGSVHPSEQAAEEAALSHALSEAAYAATRPTKAQLKRRGIKGGKAKHVKKMTPLHRLLKGPIALLTFPNVAPEQLATALKIIAPTTGSTSAFPAPRRRDAPGYYEPAVQAGLQKLLLLGARVDGKVVDQEGVKRVGGLPGLEGLRGQLVNLLSSAGMGLTRALESAGNSVWFNLESRRLDMEEQAKPKEEAKEEVKSDAPAA